MPARLLLILLLAATPSIQAGGGSNINIREITPPPPAMPRTEIETGLATPGPDEARTFQ